jgi:hypothetical protein
VRVIEYEVTNREGKGEIFCLITTIMDPQDATAAELAALTRSAGNSSRAWMRSRLISAAAAACCARSHPK